MAPTNHDNHPSPLSGVCEQIVTLMSSVYFGCLGGKKYIEKGTAHKNGVVVDEWLPAHVRKSPKVNNTPKPKKSKKEN